MSNRGNYEDRHTPDAGVRRCQPETEHTPTPWTRSCFQVYGEDKSRVAHTGMGQLPPHRSHESEANAAFIVEAVNGWCDIDSLRARLALLEAAR